MNSYNDLDTLVAMMELSGVTLDIAHNTTLVAMLEAASRLVDELCHRTFYVESTTKYYQGAGYQIFFSDDILSITTLKTDEDGDGTFENTLTEDTDFVLIDFNNFPKTWAEILPYGRYGSFAAGIRKGVEVIGVFGYGDGISATPYTATAITVTADDATETELDVSAEGTLAAGHTILVESEQMFIESDTSDATKKITVIRGVNGTTAAAHADKVASTYQYPKMVELSVLIQAQRWWQRKDTAFQDVVNVEGGGGVIVYKGLDPDVELMLKKTDLRKKQVP